MRFKRFLLLSLAIPLMVACASGQSGAVKDSSMAKDSMTTADQAVAEPAEAASADAAANSEATAMADETMADVIKSGTFVSGEKNTSGTARIISSDGQLFVELDETFQTSSMGPDLVVVLHQSEDVIGSAEPPAFPLQEGSYVSLGELESFSGAQRYAIAADIDLDAYPSVVIWCRRFNATFGAASLQ